MIGALGPPAFGNLTHGRVLASIFAATNSIGGPPVDCTPVLLLRLRCSQCSQWLWGQQEPLAGLQFSGMGGPDTSGSLCFGKSSHELGSAEEMFMQVRPCHWNHGPPANVYSSMTSTGHKDMHLLDQLFVG